MLLRAAVLLTSFYVIFNYLKPVELKAQTFNGVISRSIGGAGRAAVDPLDVGRLNPAGLVHLRNYSFGGQYREQNFSSDADGLLWSINVSDGSDGAAFPGAFTFEKRFVYTQRGRQEQDHYFVSLGQYLIENLSMGLTLHHLRTRAQQDDTTSMVNVDVGLLWTPAPWLGLGLVGYNLAGAKDGVPALANLYPSLGLGTHVILDELFRMRLDYMQQLEENTHSRGHLMAGFESMVYQWVVLRAGWYEDGLAQSRGWTAGLGFDGPRLKANVSLEAPLSGSRETRYGVDMLVQF